MDRIDTGIAMFGVVLQALALFLDPAGAGHADTNVTVNVTQSAGLPAVPPVCLGAPRRE
ncbi:hypothetical protein [Streptomyces canus]|uniref:hypothetical protein n=1 Tax=Streptomyces canus TaxID=58343 RepID=UPI0032516519